MNAFDVIDGLLKLNNAGMGIKEFFSANEVSTVAIYGLGRVGVQTYDAIKEAGVEVLYAIDKKADFFDASGNELKIISPSEIHNQSKVDLIVVTPMEYYYEIKEELELLTDIDIISIGEIVEYCLDGEELPGLKLKRCDNKNENFMSQRQQNKIDIENRSKKILVFGGSSGIGKAIARRMLDEGSEVTIVGRTKERLEETSQELSSEHLHFFVGDIAKIDTHEDMFSRAFGIMGGLDTFVNAAAISLEARGRGYEPWDITEEEWDEVSSIDYKAAFFLMRNEVDFFLNNEISGNILNISSNSVCMDVIGTYGASKLAQMRWTRAFGKRYGHNGIIINGIAPGITFTPFVSSYAKREDQVFMRHSIERFIKPAEIAELAKFCLSKEGVILCGTTIIADGGDEEAF